MLVTAYMRIAYADEALASAAGAPRDVERRVKRAIQSRAAHRLLSSILERERIDASLRLVHSPNGKPLLYRAHEPSLIAVSLSHSRAISACAISDQGAIGIDVEFRADRPFPALAATAFGPAEQRVVAREGRSAFYRIWTLREALAKAPLDGLARLTDGRDYFADALATGSWRTVIDNQDWLFWTGVLPEDYAIALALTPRPPLPGS